MTDPREVSAAGGVDREAFGRLVSPHLPRLIAYAWALCGEYQAGQDVVQEALLIAYQKREQAPAPPGLGGWLGTIVRFEALNTRRKRVRIEPLAEDLIERLYGPSSVAGSPKRMDALSSCVQSLAGRVSELVRAHYFGGLSLGEVAPRLGMSLAATKQLLYRARLALKSCIQRRLASEVTT